MKQDILAFIESCYGKEIEPYQRAMMDALLNEEVVITVRKAGKSKMMDCLKKMEDKL